MSITRDYSYRIEKKYFCEKKPLPYDQSVRVLVHLRCIPHDDPEIDFTATTLVPHATLLSDAAGPTLSPILSSLGIPSEDQTRLVHDIPSISTSLNFLETCSRCHRFLVPGIVLVIRVDEVEAVEEVDEIDHDITLPMEQRIKALEKLGFDDAGTWVWVRIHVNRPNSARSVEIRSLLVGVKSFVSAVPLCDAKLIDCPI